MATSTTAEREKRTAFPTNIPARSPYATQGNPAREFGDAASKLAASVPAPARAADGSMAGPGLTPYAPYRMAGFNRQAPQPAAVQPAARPAPAAAMAAPTPIPAVGTMPPVQEVQGANVNPLAGVPGAARAMAAATPPLMQDTRAVMSESGKEMSSLVDQGRYGAAAGEALRATTAMIPAVVNDVAIRPLAPVLAGAMDAGRQFLGINDPRTAAKDSPASKNPAANQGTGKPGATAAPGAPAPAATPAAPGAAPAARNVSAQLASVPRELPADLQDGQIYKTKDANGRPVYSGRNVGADAPMVNGAGQPVQGGGGTVSTVPGMPQAEIDAILARPLDARTAMTAAQRFQYDKEVQNAQGVNNFNAGMNRGRGTTVSDLLRSGMERRALANENTQGEITSRQATDRSRSASDVLAQRRQNESEANSTVTRRTGEVEAQGAEQIQALRTQVLEAKTPEERNAAAKKLTAISGKEQQNRYTTIAGGSTIDPGTGAVLQRPGMVLDNSTGRLVDLGAQGGGQPAVSPYPDGTRLTGKDGKIYMVKDGQPVLETE